MIDLGGALARLGLSQYFERFIQEGFDTWETVLDITESDLCEVGPPEGTNSKTCHQTYFPWKSL
jgi:hypothetical protein